MFSVSGIGCVVELVRHDTAVYPVWSRPAGSDCITWLDFTWHSLLLLRSGPMGKPSSGITTATRKWLGNMTLSKTSCPLFWMGFDAPAELFELNTEPLNTDILVSQHTKHCTVRHAPQIWRHGCVASEFRETRVHYHRLPSSGVVFITWNLIWSHAEACIYCIWAVFPDIMCLSSFLWDLNATLLMTHRVFTGGFSGELRPLAAMLELPRSWQYLVKTADYIPKFRTKPFQ